MKGSSMLKFMQQFKEEEKKPSLENKPIEPKLPKKVKKVSKRSKKAKI